MRKFQFSRSAVMVALMMIMVLVTACSGNNAAPNAAGDSNQSVSDQKEAADPGEPKVGGEITVAFEADPPALDWTSSGSFTTANIAYHIYEQLFALDKDLTVKPMLADGYELSQDQLTYTIKLRQGVNFHNGAVMKADDVLASIQRWTVVSRFGQLAAEKIESMTKIDDNTIKIQLKEPYTPLIRFFAGPQNALVIMPADIAKAAGNERFTDDKLVVGTGPYKLVSWDRGQQITLERFKEYSSRTEDWGGLTGKKVAYADKIHFNMISDAQVRVNGLNSGQFDYAVTIPQDLYDSVSTMPGIKTSVNEMKKWITIIPDKTEAPFNDVRIREALNYALNRDEIGRVTYGNPNFYKVDGSIFFPPQKDLYTTTNTEPYNIYDPEKAKALLKEAGYDGKPIRLLASSSYEDHYKSAQIVMQQLQAVGFNVEIQTYEWSTMTEMINHPKEYDLFILGFAPVFDLPLTLWLEPNYPGGFKSDRMNAIMDKWTKTTDPAEQKKLLEEVNKVVYEEYPLYKMINEVGLDAYSDHLKGYANWMGIYFWNTWLDK